MAQIILNLMTMKTIFITGATGCIGHYVLKALMERFPLATIHALVRDPKRFMFDTHQWPNLHYLGTMTYWEKPVRAT